MRTSHGFSAFLVVSVVLFVGGTKADAAQVVLLDFDTGTDGSILYTAAMRDDVEALMEGHYAAFDFSFTQVTPATGDFSTIFFNAGVGGGLAEHTDFRNVHHNDTAVVNVDVFGLATTSDIVSASAIIGSWGLGHLAGLRAGDSYGPIGSGLAS